MAKRRRSENALLRVGERALALTLEQVRTSQILVQSPDFVDRFPYLLRKGREDAGLSIRALARRAAVDATFISRLERKLAPPPTWPTMASIVAALPGSELAQVVERSGGARLRHSVLQMTNDLQKLIVSLPATTFSDNAWVNTVENQLRKCLMLVKASQDARRRK
jgi:hypothetical protein